MDLIDRQAAIDAFWQLDVEIRPSAIDAITNMLKSLSSAQPEIIHCRDCKHHEGCDYCYEVDGLWYDDDYCSKAERLEE